MLDEEKVRIKNDKSKISKIIILSNSLVEIKINIILINDKIIIIIEMLSNIKDLEINSRGWNWVYIRNINIININIIIIVLLNFLIKIIDNMGRINFIKS